MQAVYISWGQFFSVSPSIPQPAEDPHPSGPVEAPQPEGPRKSGLPKWLVAAALVAGVGVWALTQMGGPGGPTGAAAGPMTAVASSGELKTTLRVGGTVEARNYAAIRAPRMRGPRDAGSSQLTLKTLAAPGSLVNVGASIAEFELQWLIDHVDDTKSGYVQAKSDIDKQRAQNMITRESDRQALQMALGESEKATLDLRTAPIWFGTPRMPERVNAETIRAERSAADAAGIRPLPRERIDRARELGGARLEAASKGVLVRETARLVQRHSPQEKDLADGILLPKEADGNRGR